MPDIFHIDFQLIQCQEDFRFHCWHALTIPASQEICLKVLLSGVHQHGPYYPGLHDVIQFPGCVNFRACVLPRGVQQVLRWYA